VIPTTTCRFCKVKTARAEAQYLGKKAKSWAELHAYCSKCGRHFSNARDPKRRAIVWDRLERNVHPNDVESVRRLRERIIPNVMNRGNRRTKEFQMCHDRSEDALVWSVFSTLEGHELLPHAYRFLSGGGKLPSQCAVLYWGCNDRDLGIISRGSTEYEAVLQMAREPKWPGGYSEPDILLLAPGCGLVTIEAKLDSPNDRKLADKSNAARHKRAQAMLDLGREYVRRTSSLEWTWYELLRMWVPGCLLAEREHLPRFTLVNLVRAKTRHREKGRVSNDMEKCAKLDDAHTFSQVTWEDLAAEIRRWGQPSDVEFWSYLESKLWPLSDAQALR